jgi:single-strand DNA-binding protein
MYSTRIPIIGTALTKPEKRVIEKTGTVVTSFRIVSNERRYDKATDQWVDSGMLRIRVTCWRRLAEHVAKSIDVGDPIYVFGRIYTREWKTEQGDLRVSYEVDAETVGHDLNRGVTTFTKTTYAGPHSVIEDEEHDSRISGEVSYAVNAAGGHAGAGPFDDEGYGSEVAAETADDALAILREAGLAGPDSGRGNPGRGQEDTDDEDLVVRVRSAAVAGAGGGPAGRESSRGRRTCPPGGRQIPPPTGRARGWLGRAPTLYFVALAVFLALAPLARGQQLLGPSIASSTSLPRSSVAPLPRQATALLAGGWACAWQKHQCGGQKPVCAEALGSSPKVCWPSGVLS